MKLNTTNDALHNGKPKICFVALKAYNVLSGRKQIRHVGGAEVQQVRIADWLVGKGYSVSFITLDHGQPDGIDIDGIRVFKAYAWEGGVRGLRFVHPRWSGLCRAMTRANADVYYQRCAGNETGQVALWCYLHRRRFIFAAANDSDCAPSLYALQSWIEKGLYRTGLKLAHTITAQTETQREMLRKNMGVESVLVRNSGWNTAADISRDQKATIQSSSVSVLWVGRIAEQKRFEWLLDVAEQCPAIIFDVVGGPSTNSQYASSLIDRAANISNVKMHWWVPHADTARYFQGCRALCCTSAHEGFPNTFLEAWSLGIPVVSTVDPDHVIESNGLGFVAHDVEEIVVFLRKLIRSPDTWLKTSSAARQYYLDNHTPEVCLPRLERLILNVAQH